MSHTKAVTSKSTSFVSTAIPYVNASPHLGHALEFVLADAVVATRRLQGADVWFTSGTDDNSAKNVSAAEVNGTPAQTWVDLKAAQFARLLRDLAVHPNAFVRTSKNPNHQRSVLRLWDLCRSNGDIYAATYEGYYCVGCERFFRRSELPSDGKCPEHTTNLEVVHERNWFFRLSRYAEPLLRLIESDALRIVPESARRETLALLNAGLEDISVSRQVKANAPWGIPVPESADSELPPQTVWVWFDALTNYLTSLGFGEDHENYTRYWVNAGERVHVVGRGISRFHTIIWPALLLSAGLPLPTEILVHGYLTVDSVKISKSGGNAVEPFGLIARYGSDALRYFLLRHVHPTKDSDFVEARLDVAYRAELANQFGNLLSRLTALAAKRPDQTIPTLAAIDAAVTSSLEVAAPRITEAQLGFAHHDALATLLSLLADLNRYFDANAPWRLAKAAHAGDRDAARRLDEVLGSTGFGLLHTCRLLSPYLPDAAQLAITALGSHPIDGTFALEVDASVQLFPQLPPRLRREVRARVR